MYKQVIKPLFDRLVGLTLLVVTLPFMLPVIAILSVANGGHVFFDQLRPGYKRKIFRIYKLKTMTDKRGPDGNLLPDDARLTPLGRLVRKASLDEWPQLWNVVRGEMSFVGPRPLLIEYLPLYNTAQNRRHEVKPGITGWAQVNGRNSISWEQKFERDIWYVEHISFFLDMKILFLTVIRVLKREGINSNTSATMERFRGNK